jgi:ABC-type oligopeptide transport system ATPase subunit
MNQNQNIVQPLVKVENLTKYFTISKGFLTQTKATLKAVDNVSFSINQGETLGLLGNLVAARPL